MAAFAVRRLGDLPRIGGEGVDWRRIQHHFGLTGQHEAVYLVLEGAAADRFDTTWRPEHFDGVPTLDG